MVLLRFYDQTESLLAVERNMESCSIVFNSRWNVSNVSTSVNPKFVNFSALPNYRSNEGFRRFSFQDPFQPYLYNERTPLFL